MTCCRERPRPPHGAPWVLCVTGLTPTRPCVVSGRTWCEEDGYAGTARRRGDGVLLERCVGILNGCSGFPMASPNIVGHVVAIDADSTTVVPTDLWDTACLGFGQADLDFWWRCSACCLTCPADGWVLRGS